MTLILEKKKHQRTNILEKQPAIHGNIDRVKILKSQVKSLLAKLNRNKAATLDRNVINMPIALENFG